MSALASISDRGLIGVESGISGQPIDFSKILSSQDALTGIIDQLRELLPEQACTQLEPLLAGGNDLPQAAALAGTQSIEFDSINIDALFSMLSLAPLPGGAAPGTDLPAAIEQPTTDPGEQRITGDPVTRVIADSKLSLAPLPGGATAGVDLPKSSEQTSTDPGQQEITGDPGTRVTTGSDIIRNLFKHQLAEGLQFVHRQRRTHQKSRTPRNSEPVYPSVSCRTSRLMGLIQRRGRVDRLQD